MLSSTFEDKIAFATCRCFLSGFITNLENDLFLGNFKANLGSPEMVVEISLVAIRIRRNLVKLT